MMYKVRYLAVVLFLSGIALAIPFSLQIFVPPIKGFSLVSRAEQIRGAIGYVPETLERKKKTLIRRAPPKGQSKPRSNQEEELKKKAKATTQTPSKTQIASRKPAQDTGKAKIAATGPTKQGPPKQGPPKQGPPKQAKSGSQKSGLAPKAQSTKPPKSDVGKKTKQLSPSTKATSAPSTKRIKAPKGAVGVGGTTSKAVNGKPAKSGIRTDRKSGPKLQGQGAKSSAASQSRTSSKQAKGSKELQQKLSAASGARSGASDKSARSGKSSGSKTLKGGKPGPESNTKGQVGQKRKRPNTPDLGSSRSSQKGRKLGSASTPTGRKDFKTKANQLDSKSTKGAGKSGTGQSRDGKLAGKTKGKKICRRANGGEGECSTSGGLSDVELTAPRPQPSPQEEAAQEKKKKSYWDSSKAVLKKNKFNSAVLGLGSSAAFTASSAGYTGCCCPGAAGVSCAAKAACALTACGQGMFGAGLVLGGAKMVHDYRRNEAKKAEGKKTMTKIQSSEDLATAGLNVGTDAQKKATSAQQDISQLKHDVVRDRTSNNIRLDNLEAHYMAMGGNPLMIGQGKEGSHKE